MSKNPCRQAVPTSTTLPTPAAQGKCSTVFPLNYTQASAKEAGNKPIISATLPLRCLPTWEVKDLNRSDGPGIIEGTNFMSWDSGLIFKQVYRIAISIGPQHLLSLILWHHVNHCNIFASVLLSHELKMFLVKNLKHFHFYA